jgi:hypothetical protein
MRSAALPDTITIEPPRFAELVVQPREAAEAEAEAEAEVVISRSGGWTARSATAGPCTCPARALSSLRRRHVGVA